jgi:hypothetical protein
MSPFAIKTPACPDCGGNCDPECGRHPSPKCDENCSDDCTHIGCVYGGVLKGMWEVAEGCQLPHPDIGRRKAQALMRRLAPWELRVNR